MLYAATVDPSFVLVPLVDGCIGWLGALVLIVVGSAVVAKADKGAGFTLAGAGALKLLLNCCVVAPSMAMQFGTMDIDPSVFTTNAVLIQLQRLVFFGLLAFAITRLSKPSDTAEVLP
ncbi:MAG: hypothetical protein DRJ42_15820 [Deltaproteobacteria bacterium]|nr:MAG: hypothetical protein DRJ42_15820 [Deltaproteobacteria bacterium]